MRWLFSTLSPGAAKARLSILIFHRVLAQADPLFPDEVDAERFGHICAWVRQWFNVLPLPEAARRLREGNLPPRALAITFDDGYADNHDVALPILQRNGLVASFFVATGFIDGGRMWNDTLIESVRRARVDVLRPDGAAFVQGDGTPMVLPLADVAARRSAIDALIKACRYLPGAERDAAVAAVARASGATLPHDLMMAGAQVRALHDRGMDVGGHTVNHPILTRLPLADARQEIADGKQHLEAITGAPLRSFAYPNGRPGQDFADEHVQLVRELGFECAVTTGWGVSDVSTDAFQLRRFTPWDRSRLGFGLRMARNVGVTVPA